MFCYATFIAHNKTPQVDTNPGYFRKAGIEFLGVPATDSPTFPIRSYFHDAASFIEQGLYGGGGKNI